MIDLGTQVVNLLNRRFKKVVSEAMYPFLKDIFQEMNDLTSSGRTFPDLMIKYKPYYSPRHATAREKAGYLRDNVDLRMGERRIEKSRQTSKSSEHVEIGFERGGNIFYAHHFGEGKMKNSQRMIFPENMSQVPDNLKEKMYKRVAAIMNGRNV
jgi:hypothetical protein